MSTRNLKARRKLSALYERGAELRFGPNGPIEGPFDGPPSDDVVAMWVGPPSPLQREMALRDAQASRAKALLRMRTDNDSEERLTGLAFLSEMSMDTLIDYILQHDSEDRRGEAVRDVLRQDDWKDITSLQEAFRPYDEGELDPDPEDPDYRALMDADKKYGDQVDDRLKELTEASRYALQMLSRGELERRALEKRGDLIASQAFMAEYERQMLFYAVREADDHGVLFFESARELAGQDDAVQTAIARTLQAFVNEVPEAKNSPGAEAGSPQSDPPSEPETSESSTPQEPTE